MNSSSLAEQFKLPESLKPGKIALIVGGAGLLLSAVGFFVDAKQFYHSYLAAFVFWTTIALGGLFFTMLHHLTGATWSVVLRRFSEAIMVILPVLAILFLPIIPGMHDLYHWTHEEAVAAEDPPGTPRFDILRVEPDGSVVVAGSALPGRAVRI